MADQGTDAMEREKAFLFASQEGRFLWHIDEALRRLYRSPETFGKCHNCGNDIAFERLDALPHARYCIECKQREEDAKKSKLTRSLFWPVLLVVVVVDVITKAIAANALLPRDSARGAGRNGAAHARVQPGRRVRTAPRAVLALDLHGAHDRRAGDSVRGCIARRAPATRRARSRSRSCARARSAT